MRRLLTDLARFPLDLVSTLVRGWNDFFFTPADPTPLALVRIGTGLLLFWSLAVGGFFDLHAFYGSTSWADPESVRQLLDERGGWTFWLYVSDSWLLPVWLGCLAVVLMFTAGLFSRTTAILAWVIAVSTARRTPGLLFGFDQIISTWALYLAVSGASGQAISLDRFIARLRAAWAVAARRRIDGANAGPPRWSALGSGVPAPSVAANLGLRLIQLHLTLIYANAGLAKLRGDAWWNGRAAWGLMSAAEFSPVDFSWVAAYPRLIEAATHIGLLLELALPFLLWARPLRPLGLAVALVMHASIGLMLGLNEFSLAMITGCLAFASGPWLREVVAGRGIEEAGRVLYDAGCPRCRASIALALAADPGRAVDPVDYNTTADLKAIHPSLTVEACHRSMHFVSADGRTVRVGFDAVRALACRLPLFWPLAVAGFVPGVAQIGRIAYNRIAAARPRDGQCNDETCGIHAPHAQDPAQSAAKPGRRP